jgi:uncharacterized protein
MEAKDGFESPEQEWNAKKQRLAASLRELDGLLVAFSGGVDSSVLLHAAHAALGERAVGVIADSASLPRRELAQALELAQRIGARVEVVATDEGEDERYRANAGDRCYWCKSALFDAMDRSAEKLGIAELAFGEITDDRLEDRPGARAARERRVRAPLADAAFTKQDVRRYAREFDLPVAEKPSSACLASRIPVGTRVTAERLARVEAAEEALYALGFRVLRVRDHGSSARVEVGSEEIAHARSQAESISASLAALGFRDVELTVYRAPSAHMHG